MTAETTTAVAASPPANGHKADIDLGDVLQQDAPVIRFPVWMLDPSKLGIGEVIEIAELAGIDFDQVEKMLARGNTTGARTGLALAYVLTRRIRPDLTWADMQRYQVRWERSAPDPPVVAGRAPGLSPGSPS